MKPDLRADYKIRLYTGPKTLFFEVSNCIGTLQISHGQIVPLGKAIERIALDNRMDSSRF